MSQFSIAMNVKGDCLPVTLNDLEIIVAPHKYLTAAVLLTRL